jgi:hypothetical protein
MKFEQLRRRDFLRVAAMTTMTAVLAACRQQTNEDSVVTAGPDPRAAPPAVATATATLTAEEALLSGAVGPPTAAPTATPAPRTGLIERVATDKAMYAPGMPVQIVVELRNRIGAPYTGRITLAFYHLGAPAADEQTQPVAALASDARATA